MTRFAIFSLAVLLLASEPAGASQIYGPFSDGEALIQPGSTLPHTEMDRYIYTHWWFQTPTRLFEGWDKIPLREPVEGPVGGPIIWQPDPAFTVVSTIFVSLPDPGQLTLTSSGNFLNTAILTTVYGQKQGYGSVTGFTNPSAFEPTQEIQYGNTGKEYLSYSSQRISGTDLSTALVGYDLTSFDLGTTAPYQIFQTEIPVFEISAVPEPSALALLLVGISGLACVRLKAKRPKSL